MTVGWPLNHTSPSSGKCTPEISLISVDFPAALSPAIASTSPGATSNDTLLSA